MFEIMARCEGKAVCLALDVSQMALCCVVFSRLPMGPPGAFLSKKKKKNTGQVQSYKGKHCSLVGIQHINI